MGAHLMRVQPCQDWIISNKISAGVFCVLIKVVKAKPGGDPSQPVVQGWTEIFEADYDNPEHADLVNRTAESRKSAETGLCRNKPWHTKLEECIFTMDGHAGDYSRKGELESTWSMAKVVQGLDELVKIADGAIREVYTFCFSLFCSIHALWSQAVADLRFELAQHVQGVCSRNHRSRVREVSGVNCRPELLVLGRRLHVQGRHASQQL